ncbi:MAG: CPBP family intramembrane glutamic endopeptidase [Planctomycetaceae bacterium]
MFILVIGEEIGWRGFALPLLLQSFGATSSSVIIGTMWAIWHPPLFLMTSMPQYGSPFLPFVIYTVSLSTILTFLYSRTHGSIIVSTLFHGAVNTIGIVNVAASSELRGWSNALSYGLAVLVISGVTGKTRICR